MAIQSSGLIKITDIVSEFGGSVPHSLSEYYRNGGSVPANNTSVPTSGTISISNFYSAVNEIQITASNATNVVLATVFGSDWSSSVPKRYIVPSGVTIGGTYTHALYVSSGMGGSLIMDIDGYVYGHGGSAGTSGAGGTGGNAVYCQHTSNVTINLTSNGRLYGGGGGGGRGGTGGQGGTGGPGGISRPRSFIFSQLASGPGGAGGAGGAGGQGQGYNQSRTTGSGGSGGSGGSPGGAGQQGPYGGTFQGVPQYGYSGGPGGAGGSGGSGGTGGTGGYFGYSGSNGASGNGGSSGSAGSPGQYVHSPTPSNQQGQPGSGGSSGSNGSGGGLAGYYIYNRASITFNNSGSVSGR